jgi:hypothetical protein
MRRIKIAINTQQLAAKPEIVQQVRLHHWGLRVEIPDDTAF